MKLPPVPRRAVVLKSQRDGPPVIALVISAGFIADDWDLFLSTVAEAVDLSTPAGTFANNAAAVLGGLSPGQFYQTATGEVRVVV